MYICVINNMWAKLKDFNANRKDIIKMITKFKTIKNLAVFQNFRLGHYKLEMMEIMLFCCVQW